MAGSRGSALVARKSTFSINRALTPGAALVPVVAPERAAGQTELHDVEELAVAGIDLQLAVMKHVVSAADTRSNLVAPAEVEIGKPCGIESRVLLVVQADADIQCQSAVSDRPGILNVDSLVCRF